MTEPNAQPLEENERIVASSKELTLSVEERERVGTPNAHKLGVSTERFPRVLYGHGTAPLHLALEARAFDDLLHHGGRTGVITLTIGGKKADTALVRDDRAQSGHAKGRSRRSAARLGTRSRARKTAGRHRRHLARRARFRRRDGRARCTKSKSKARSIELPEQLEVDVADLGIHQHIIACDIKLPQGLQAAHRPRHARGLRRSVEDRTESRRRRDRRAANRRRRKSSAASPRRNRSQSNALHAWSWGSGTPEKSTNEPGTMPGSWLSTRSCAATASMDGRARTPRGRSTIRRVASSSSSRPRS